VAAAMKMGATPVPKQSNSAVSAMVDRGGLRLVPSPPFLETIDFLIEQRSFALSARFNTLSRMRLSKNCLKRENCPHRIAKGSAHGCPLPDQGEG
jgi:hypothetical protein